MYLLNPGTAGYNRIDLIDLHSTMYLLNLSEDGCLVEHKTTFTFHYVSIKWVKRPGTSRVWRDLHSTMYLLNASCISFNSLRTSFTFHYVSIKLGKAILTYRAKNHLHSTMYLLNSIVDICRMIKLAIYIPLCIY